MEIFNKKLGIILIILVFGAIVSFFSIHYFIQKEIKSSLEVQKAYQATLEEIIPKRVLCLIDKGKGKILEYQVIPSPDSTVFSLLEELSQRENFEIESTLYEGIGVFVETIDGLKGGTDNKWWQYWVNDELPMIAADKKEIKGGDKIEWKFEVPLEF